MKQVTPHGLVRVAEFQIVCQELTYDVTPYGFTAEHRLNAIKVNSWYTF